MRRIQQVAELQPGRITAPVAVRAAAGMRTSGGSFRRRKQGVFSRVQQADGGNVSIKLSPKSAHRAQFSREDCSQCLRPPILSDQVTQHAPTGRAPIGERDPRFPDLDNLCASSRWIGGGSKVRESKTIEIFVIDIGLFLGCQEIFLNKEGNIRTAERSDRNEGLMRAHFQRLTGISQGSIQKKSISILKIFKSCRKFIVRGRKSAFPDSPDGCIAGTFDDRLA